MQIPNCDNIEEAPSSTVLPSLTILSVSELTFAIKEKLENSFPEVLVQGEISNFKPNTSGHLYFDLKDAGAKIPAVFFRGKAGTLLRLPKEGDQVTLKGVLSVYAPHGRYQLIVSELRYLGIGELLLKLEALKAKLKSQGYFDKGRKKPLPKFPSRIGVITSPTGAVIRDIIQILTRRAKGFHLILNPVKVQGNEAAGEIAQAIIDFNKYQLADVLIVGRGGGSLEDLWPFNEEVVQNAIFASKIPIISAVGHETDFTIADFVADLRAPTPSAAAEMVLSEQKEHLNFLAKTKVALVRTLSHLIEKDKARLARFSTQPIFKKPERLLLTFFQKLNELERDCDRTIIHRLERAFTYLQTKEKTKEMLRPDLKVAYHLEKIGMLEEKLDRIFANLYTQKILQLKKTKELLNSFNPKRVLERGYSILFDQKGGSAIVSASSLTPGKGVYALLADGEAEFITKDCHSETP